MRIRYGVLCILFGLIPIGAICQVTAHTDQSHQMQSLDSPMVLEIQLSDFSKQPENQEWSTSESERFACLGVSLKKLTLRYKIDAITKKITIKGKVLLFNGGSEDTITTVLYELVRKDQVLCTDREAKIGTEEDERRERHFRLDTPCEAKDCLAECELRLTFNVVPD